MKILSLNSLRMEWPRILVKRTRKLTKGFIRLGHDVFEYSYLEAMRKFRFNIQNKVARELKDIAHYYQPDVIIIQNHSDLPANLIFMLREQYPAIPLIYTCGDILTDDQGNPIMEPRVKLFANCLDWFCITSGGPTLEIYKKAGVKHCAFLPNCSDPDLEHPYPPEEEFRCELLFTGKMQRDIPGFESQRTNILKALREKRNITLYPDSTGRKIYALDYFKAISSAKIALSINGWNHVPLYHSSRLHNYLSCGAFVLSIYTPQSELLFQDGQHLRYFHGLEGCLELIDYYLEHDAERQTIARQGMAFTHANYNPSRIAGHLLSLIEKGSYDAPYAQVI